MIDLNDIRVNGELEFSTLANAPEAFHLPPNVPADAFWSMTLYDVDTRCIIRKKQGIADRSSRMDLLVNEDGSIDLYFGPDTLAGKEQNWIPTVPGKAWFPYFRFYSPTREFLDKSWVLPDIEKA